MWVSSLSICKVVYQTQYSVVLGVTGGPIASSKVSRQVTTAKAYVVGPGGELKIRGLARVSFMFFLTRHKNAISMPMLHIIIHLPSISDPSIRRHRSWLHGATTYPKHLDNGAACIPDANVKFRCKQSNKTILELWKSYSLLWIWVEIRDLGGFGKESLFNNKECDVFSRWAPGLTTHPAKVTSPSYTLLTFTKHTNSHDLTIALPRTRSSSCVTICSASPRSTPLSIAAAKSSTGIAGYHTFASLAITFNARLLFGITLPTLAKCIEVTSWYLFCTLSSLFSASPW